MVVGSNLVAVLFSSNCSCDNQSFESFALDHTTFALLRETTLFLTKKYAVSVYVLSHLADFRSRLSLRKYYLLSTTCFDSSLITTGPACPNHGSAAAIETFNIHSSLIHVVIRYICIGHFTHIELSEFYVALLPVFLSRHHL